MPAAARVHDPIEHSSALTGLLAGVVAGIAVGAFIVLTGGAGSVLVGAAIIGMGASTGGGLGEALGSLSIFNSDKGELQTGSPDVAINGRPAAVAQLPMSLASGDGSKSACAGALPWGLIPHGPKYVAEGSGTVFINDKPAARVKDSLECSAKIRVGSANVFIGGPQVQTLPIAGEVPAWANKALLWTGIASSVVLFGPIVTLFSTAGGYGGGQLGHWAGGALFGEGSDGQKLSELFGSIVGASLGGRAGQKVAQSKTVTTFLDRNIGRPASYFVRSGVPRTSGPSGTAAKEAAAEMRKQMSNNQLGKRYKTAAVVNKKTGEVVTDTSGDTPESPMPNTSEIDPRILEQYPDAKKTAWQIENCAELKALNKALKQAGPQAKISDFEVATLSTKTGLPAPRCPNCRHTTHGVRAITDPIDAFWSSGLGPLVSPPAQETK